MTLDVWSDCWRIRIPGEPKRSGRGGALADQSKSPNQKGGRLERATQESWVRKRQDVEHAG